VVGGAGDGHNDEDRAPRRGTEAQGDEGTVREIIAAPTLGLDLNYHYGHHQSVAIRAGGLIFCSGMVAVNPDTGEREHGTVTSEPKPFGTAKAASQLSK
jgi:enamine deaminase RidA (YjgF/YER057c/UK114 family)